AIEPDAVKVRKVGVAGLAPIGQEVELALGLVYFQQLRHHKIALRNLVLHLAAAGVVEVEVAPVVAL
nr:hypothetical protein [Tanacetum cinerariifolium]